MVQPAASTRALIDAATRHQIYLLRFGNGLFGRMESALASADARLVDQIQLRLSKLSQGDLLQIPEPNWTTRRLQALLDEIRAISQIIRDISKEQLVPELRNLALYEAQFQQRMIERAVRIDWSFNTVAPQQLRSAVTSQPFLGRHLRDYVNDLVGARRVRSLQAIREGYLLGETTPQIVRRLREFVTDRSTRDLEWLVRTSTNHVASHARDLLYEENQDLVKAVRWVATLDGRTTPVCRSRDGNQYPVGRGPRTPAHINCRSTTVPVLRSYRELGIEGIEEAPDAERPTVSDARTRRERERDFRRDARARVGDRNWRNMNETQRRTEIGIERDRWKSENIDRVPATTTYNSWLRTQDRDFVVDVLGQTRARLYLDGQMSLDHFVDRTGRQYTLPELRRRESDIFDRVGL